MLSLLLLLLLLVLLSNSFLYGAPIGTIQKLQRVQNNAAWIVLQMPRRSHAKLLLHSLHGCRLMRESSTRWRWSHSAFSAPQRQSVSADTYSPATVCGIYGRRTLLLCQPFTKTDLARRGFRYSAPAIWNSLPRTVLESPSITVFKSRLKTHLFDLAHIKQ